MTQDAPALETFASTASSIGVMSPSWRARMTAFQRPSSFFHPAA